MKPSFLQKFFTSPLLWGGLLSVGFYAILLHDQFAQPLLLRYFAGHPVEYITTVMFFVGLAALMLKFFWVTGQRRILRRMTQYGSLLGEKTAKKIDVRYADRYLNMVDQHESQCGLSLISQRLRAALLCVKRGGTSDELDNELRCLSEDDGTKADADYGLVRLILWAVPMLGFLGTVIGITMALGDLDLNAINESSQKLSAGLSIAFDTTALAIALDLALYFLQFIVYREESRLLWEVDRQAGEEMRGRFELNISTEDSSQAAAMRKMLENVGESIASFMEQQTEIWDQAFSVVQERLSQVASENAIIIKQAFSEALGDNLAAHSRLLAQTDMMEKILAHFRELASAEERLQQNLATVAQVGHFEETVNSLAAAIHLLNGRHRFVEIRNEKDVA